MAARRAKIVAQTWLYLGIAMALRSSDKRDSDVGAGGEAYPRDGGKRRPIAAAFRVFSRLVLGIPTFLGAIVIGVCLFGVAVGVGGYVGFMLATDLWSAP